MSPTVYLVSGANRGLGLALVTALVERADVVVFAGARQPGSAAELQALAKAHSGKLYVLKLTSADEADNRAAVMEIQRVAGRLDVVIANAAIANWEGETVDAPLAVMREHYEVNVLGVLALFQATHALLKASTPAPKFVPISSGVGSVAIGPTIPVRNIPYGMSKAALNFVARKLRAENPELVCVPICPGLIETDMSASARENIGEAIAQLKLEWKTPDETAQHVLARVDEFTRETDAFVQWNGETWPW